MTDKPQAMPDYYNILGIERNADEETIRKAFRGIAKETHPDVGASPELVEKFKQANEAFQVLTRKKSEYDSMLSATEKLTQQQQKRAESSASTSWDEVFSSWFGEEGFLRNRSPYKMEIRQKQIYLPENDLGLISALVKAYQSENDGKWRVKHAETDKREWLPDELYSVVKRKGDVLIFRRIIDWRNSWEREDPIKMRDKNEKWRDDPEATKPADFWFGEYYLAGEGQDLISAGVSPVHYLYGDYLRAIKTYSKKIAEGGSDYQKELTTISRFAEVDAKNIRIEGNSLFSSDENREWVRKYDVTKMSELLKSAEGRVVQLEGNKSSVEGNMKNTKTNTPQSSGEALG